MLEAVQNNINRLIALYESERQERILLSDKLQEREAQIESYEKQIADLKREVDNLKLTHAFTAPVGGNKDARDRINMLLADIDKCISLLDR